MRPPQSPELDHRNRRDSHAAEQQTQKTKGRNRDARAAQRIRHTLSQPARSGRDPADAENTNNRDRTRAIEIDDPLYVYRRNRIISVVQRDAGLILRKFWNRTGREPRVTSQYSDMIVRGSAEGLHITSADHNQRFVEAVRAVGPIGSDTVVSVVCMQDFVPRGHYEILRRALDILAKKFGLERLGYI